MGHLLSGKLSLYCENHRGFSVTEVTSHSAIAASATRLRLLIVCINGENWQVMQDLVCAEVETGTGRASYTMVALWWQGRDLLRPGKGTAYHAQAGVLSVCSRQLKVYLAGFPTTAKRELNKWVWLPPVLYFLRMSAHPSSQHKTVAR